MQIVLKNCAYWLVFCLGLPSATMPALQVQPASTLAQAIPRIGRVERHPITIREIVSLRKPSNVRISPDGTLVAYVVTRPVLEHNQDHAILYVTSATSLRSPRILAEGIHINTVRWFPDSQTISYILETRSGVQIWRVHLDAAQPEQLTDSNLQIAQCWETTAPENCRPYDMSPDGSHLVYAAYDTTAADREESEAVRGGVVFTGKSLKPLSVLELRRVPLQLWLWDSYQRNRKKLLTTKGVQGLSIPEFRWSHDGKRVALLYQAADTPQYTLAVLESSTKKVGPLLTTLGFSRGLTWSDDDQSLIFYSEGIMKPGQSRASPAVYSFRLNDESLHQLGADRDSLRLAFQSSSEGAAVVERLAEKHSGDLLSFCSLDRRKTRAACIREAPVTRPEVVTVDLSDGEPVGAPRSLTNLNPEYDSIELGSISRLTWPNREGDGNSGLILPVGFVQGKRYPLVVMLYNLYSGRKFIADAPGFTSYPAQAFAGHGYVVLLMNVPKYYLYPAGDFAAAREAQVDAVVADIRSAVEILDARGLIDVKRMGIMGWSSGCFWTNYIVTHLPTWFQAAASGECAAHYPGQYWLGDEVWRERERDFFGGGPYGKYYSRWKEISPVLNADRLRVPLLMEYSKIYTAGLEMRTAILEEGGQTELVLYADDEHILLRPQNRYNSMMRHYDWFNFWLLGEEDANPAKRAQYTRWRQMREKLAAR